MPEKFKYGIFNSILGMPSQKIDAKFFDEEYFLKGTKSNYGGKFAAYTREHFLPQAMKKAIQIQDTLNPKTVLDVGCGRGYLVFALRSLDVNAWGVDISEWAIANCEKKIAKFLKLGNVLKLSKAYPKRQFDLVVADDLLEHVHPKKAQKAVEQICKKAKTWAKADVINQDNGVDKSHQTILPNRDWVRMFADCGFKLAREQVVKQADGNVSGRMLLKRRDAPLGKKLRYVVLIPVYNAERTLPLCLEYVGRLDPPPEKVVFCENNSTDRTLEIVANYPGEKELIQFNVASDFLVGKHTHTVIGNARQMLLQKARELDPDYALFIDADVLALDRNLVEKVHYRELDLLGAPYYRNFPEGLFLGTLFPAVNPKPGDRYSLRASVSLDLETVEATSAGALFLSNKILKDKRLNFVPLLAKMWAEDFGFCAKAKALGYPTHLDSTINVHHMTRESMGKVKPWTQKDGKFADFRF